MEMMLFLDLIMEAVKYVIAGYALVGRKVKTQMCIRDSYYMTVGDKEKIYTVDYSVVNAMNFDLDSMLQKDTFPSIGADNIKKAKAFSLSIYPENHFCFT